MDLHDYIDVAQNYDNYLSVMYGGVDKALLDFYSELAAGYGQGGVIDIACGTGAVLLHLAQRGFDVDGTDLSEAMVDVSRKKAAGLGLSLNIFAGNMTDFTSARKYSLAIIARSGFMHLTTPGEQRKALLNIREHLLPGGILTLNTFAPNIELQYGQIKTSPDDYTFRLEYVNADGQREKIYNAISYDPVTQVMSGDWKFETLGGDGEVIETRIRPLKMRQTYKTEMEYLIELSGFEIVSVYGDYDRNPASNGNLIWILRKIEN
ncbi:MAG: class I SAM-dependent methyltransferase [Oscillospiraceae bacterium]|nr:class I SAM-dependent methyltransferase [Oscillospiraceae bacterium]